MTAAVPLSQCLPLWQTLNNFYAQGQPAFDKTPYKLTNSAYLADAYADLLITYLLEAPLNPDEPVYVLELAAGTGSLVPPLLQALQRKQAQFTRLRHIRLCYVMTDMAESSVAFWQQHPQLQEAFAQGRLKAAVFNPLTDRQLPVQTVNPLLVVANYFFDSLPHDLWRVSGGRLLQGLVSVSSLNPDEPDFDALKLDVAYQPALPDYPHHWSSVLAQYQRTLTEATVILPVGGWQVLDNLRAMAPAGLVFLTSDKGWSDPTVFETLTDIGFTRHGGISYAVNFDALRGYAGQYGYRHTQLPYTTLQTAMMTLDAANHPGEYWPYVFEETLNRKNPVNTLFHLPLAYRADLPADGQIEGLISLMRLSCQDPAQFVQHAKRFCELAPHMSSEQEAETLAMLEQVWRQYLYHPSAANVLFYVGHLLFVMNRLNESRLVFEQALQEQRPGELGQQCQAAVLNSLALVYEAWAQQNPLPAGQAVAKAKGV